jgi:hypothetical protein
MVNKKMDLEKVSQKRQLVLVRGPELSGSSVATNCARIEPCFRPPSDDGKGVVDADVLDDFAGGAL